MNREIYNLSAGDIDHFDDIFSKRLTKDEFVIIQMKLDVDEVYRYKFNLYKSIRKEITAEGEANQTLRKRFKKLDLKQKSKGRLVWLSLGIAASLAIALLLILNKSGNDAINKEIYATYKFSDPGLPIKMDSHINAMDSAMAAYTKNNFAEAIILLQPIQLNDTSTYYQGLCHEMINNEKQAENLYKKALNSSSTYIAQKAKFRLALLYLKENNKRYKRLWDEIALDQASPYQESAIKIKLLLSKH